jgi:DNA-binding IclR family transcriptional regulator
MADKYTNASQQRIIKLMLIMFGDVVNGYLPSELAKALNATPATLTRDLNNLETAGIARPDEQTGRWRLTPRLPQQAIKVFNAIEAADLRVQEARNRFTRST